MVNYQKSRGTGSTGTVVVESREGGVTKKDYYQRFSMFLVTGKDPEFTGDSRVDPVRSSPMGISVVGRALGFYVVSNGLFLRSEVPLRHVTPEVVTRPRPITLKE